jgi:hypothetical protein
MRVAILLSDAVLAVTLGEERLAPSHLDPFVTVAMAL